MAGETTCPKCGRQRGNNYVDQRLCAVLTEWDYGAIDKLDCYSHALSRVTAELAAERAWREQAEAALQGERASHDGVLLWNGLTPPCRCALCRRIDAALAPRASGEGQP